MTRGWWIVAGCGLAGCLDFGPRATPDAGADAVVAQDQGMDARVADAAPMPDQAPLDQAPSPDAALDAASDQAIDAAPDMAPDAGPVDITTWSTDFDDAESIAAWSRLNPEGFRFVDAGSHHASRLTVRPALGGWHEGRTAGLLFVEIEGDFIVETEVIAGRIGDLTQAPSESYNVAGLMARDPAAGLEDWFFAGVGQLAGRRGIEGKSTVASVSTQWRTDVEVFTAALRLCRRGPDVYLLFRLDGDAGWRSARTEDGPLVREALPARLQVGIFANGWNGTEEEPATEGVPDLEAVFERIAFRVPANVGDCLE